MRIASDVVFVCWEKEMNVYKVNHLIPKLNKILIAMIMLTAHLSLFGGELWRASEMRQGVDLKGKEMDQMDQWLEDPTIIDLIAITPDARALHTVDVTMVLGDGHKLTFTTVNIRKTNDGHVVWRGQPENGKLGSAVIVQSPDGGLVGKIDVESGFYRISHTSPQHHFLLHQERVPFVACGDAPPSRMVGQKPAELQPLVKRHFHLDVLVLYTNMALAADPNLVAAIRGEEEVTRETLDNIEGSLAATWMKFNIVGIESINYSETGNGNSGTAFSFLKNNATVATLRDQYRADVVAMVMSGIDGNLEVIFPQFSGHSIK